MDVSDTPRVSSMELDCPGSGSGEQDRNGRTVTFERPASVGLYAVTREPTLWSKAYIAPVDFSIFSIICTYSSAHCSSSICSLTNHWSISVVAGSSASAVTLKQA